jgi:hypothetical protein
MPPITNVSIIVDTSPERALEFMRKLARDDDFRQLVAEDPESTLAEAGITFEPRGILNDHHQGLLPPKHVVEQALVNVPHANEFNRPTGEFEGIDAFGFWLLFPLIGT